MFKESLSPHAHHLPASIQARGDLVVAQSLGGEENHTGAKNLKIRQRILRGNPVEFTIFFRRENYLIWAGTGHWWGTSKRKYARYSPTAQYNMLVYL
jgi:hypothetical protein